MKPLRKYLVYPALALGALALPAMAGSLAASSAAGGSSASSASSGSIDTSSEKSSDSSTKKTAVKEGPYRIVDVTTVPERPGTVRITLHALAEPGSEGELLLYVPQQTFEQSRLAAGQTVTARQRPYGTEFAHADTRKAFFLLLSDDWYRELPSRPVVL